MAITPLAPLDRTSPTFRTDVDNFFGSAIPAFVGQANALAANLNSIAAGGAYAIPYRWDLGSTSGGLSTGAAASQQAATSINVNFFGYGGIAAWPLLFQFGQSSSAVKGQIRVVKMSDPSAFLIFNVTQAIDTGAYWIFNGTMVSASSANPFSPSDSVMLFFQPTGDKGDTGPAYIPKIMLIRDQRGPGVGPQMIPSGAWTTRDINTVAINQIADAYVTDNKFRLPPGKFWIEAQVPIMQSGAFTTRLFNVTSNGMHDMGTSGFAATGGSPSSTYSHISSFFASAVPHEFRIEHLVGIVSPGGSAHPSEANFYTQIKVTQVG